MKKFIADRIVAKVAETVQVVTAKAATGTVRKTYRKTHRHWL